MEDTLGLGDKQETQSWQLVDDGDLSRTDVSHGSKWSHLQVIPKSILSLLTPVAAWGPRSYNLRQLRKKFDSRKRILRLFTPVAEWGLRSYNLRKLRKKFDSRQYVQSQAPRDLRRNLIEKIEKTSYKLDIIYEERRRRVTFTIFN
ncbi:unnamed protein product [Danaus chrysippus]|uniref:(African queen) hypothetical protein n=1 Tax=Danaus chrysippus TaxID=151541 RepID=A0A8J2R2Y3_9NEOP|nr:unnamed protein product [Danaus chrysippus]